MVAPVSVDAYFESLSDKTHPVLHRLRELIRAELPEDATERISYAIPAFAVDGKVVIFFAGWAKHVSMYPVPPGSAAFEKRIAPYVTGKGTVSFALDTPLPEPLIREIARASLAAHRARMAAKPVKTAKPEKTAKPVETAKPVKTAKATKAAR
jgi:uncharacterized protein YdhG (YjbR/CyaY superfamily)